MTPWHIILGVALVGGLVAAAIDGMVDHPMIELVVIVVAGLVIFDVVYELCRVWLRHVEQSDALERAAQRRRRGRRQ